MTSIERDGYRFCVDLPATQAYYERHSLCDCSCCRNLYAGIQKHFPKLDAFLRDFGVDIARPDEASSSEEGASIEYFEVDYTVCGHVEAMGEYEFDLADSIPVHIAVRNGFVAPNEQTGEYFTLSVYGIRLPWVLDEPVPQPQSVRRFARTKQILNRKHED